MIRETLRHWFGMNEPTLALQLVEQEARYVVRHGSRILEQGSCFAPNAIVDGHLSNPAELARVLLPKLPKIKGQVAALLPTRWLHLHEMSLPHGLDGEELSYQISRHITHTLGLSLNDVFYDWTTQSDSTDRHKTNIQLAIARQTDVAPYYHVFVDTDWKMKWVCSEAQVWALAYQKRMAGQAVAICQVESREISFWVIDKNLRVHSFYKRFDDNQIVRAGFVYQTSTEKEGSLKLPARFVADELAVLLPVWLGASLQDLAMIYGTGKGVSWRDDMAVIQSRVGLPIRMAEDKLTSDKLNSSSVRSQAGLAILWHLSKQVNA
ncbi:MAG: hypothetical protein H6R05_1652 [Burkholderiaceae bacterium]|nr:hypothetical protein [Burkholderiaceae bacterium]